MGLLYSKESSLVEMKGIGLKLRQSFRGCEIGLDQQVGLQ